MTDELDDLAALAEAAVDEARQYEDDITDVFDRSVHDFRGDDETLGKDELDTFVDDLFDELDDLYGVDTDEGLRDYIDSRVSYDWRLGEHAKRTGRNTLLTGSMLAAGTRALDPDGSTVDAAIEVAQDEPLLGAVGAAAAACGVAAIDKATKRIGTASYVQMPYPVIDHKHRDINISPDKEPAGFAYPAAIAEVAHAYQDIWNSPSFDDPVYEEGMDVGTQLAVGERLQDGSLTETNAWQRAHTLTFTYGKLASEDNGIDPEKLEDIGLTPEEAEEAVERYGSRNSGIRDRETALIGGAALYTAAQQDGYEVYEDVFHGDYDSLPDWEPFHK